MADTLTADRDPNTAAAYEDRERLTPDTLAHLREVAAIDDEKFATYIPTEDVRLLIAAYDEAVARAVRWEDAADKLLLERDKASAEVVAQWGVIGRLTAERDKARADYQFMVDRAANEKLDGYRELGARAAQAENERDAALGTIRQLNDTIASLRAHLANALELEP